MSFRTSVRPSMTKADEKEALKAIERALNSGGSKSDRARALFALGLTRTEVSVVVPMNYSQAHAIFKAVSDGLRDGTIPVGSPTRAARSKAKASLDPEAAGPPDLHFRTPHHSLNLTPAQTRIVRQDGHWVLKDMNEQGTKCRAVLKSGEPCGRAIQFSIRELAFVHTGSRKPITEMEERYA